MMAIPFRSTEEAVSYRLSSIEAIANLANHVAASPDACVYQREISQALEIIRVMGIEVNNLLEFSAKNQAAQNKPSS